MRFSLTLATACFIAATSTATAQPQVELRPVLEGLEAPVLVASPPGDLRLFIVEQGGRIRIAVDGALLDDPFLDLSDRTTARGERGLLGLAFHPDFAGNGRFFVNYTDSSGDTQVVAYSVAADHPDRADPDSARTVLSVDQPAGNHNGGWLGFGPDGYLWIALGDGGGAGDQFGNGQNAGTLLGAMLRIDVDGGTPYAIPQTNPFAAGGGAAEIFAYGLRNPWRAAFDGEWLYIADVGQNEWEEVNVITTGDAGANLGWNIMEGSECFRARSCQRDGLVLPVHTYSHDIGCSITGGHVYRGTAIPELEGHYFFGDYCSGRVFSFRYEGRELHDLVDWSRQWGSVGAITSFGTDAAGELYVVLAEGRVLKLVPTA